MTWVTGRYPADHNQITKNNQIIFNVLQGDKAVLAPAKAGTLANSVNVARKFPLRGLSVAKFGNRKMPDKLPSAPTSPSAVCAFG